MSTRKANGSGMNTEEKVLAACEGVEVKTQNKTFNNGQPYQTHSFHMDDKSLFAVPHNIFIEIYASATAGTIGKLVDIDFGDDRNRRNNQLYVHDITWIIQVEGKEGTNRIARYHSDILVGHDGSTKYVRNTNKHVKEVIPPHVNKYHQTLHKDFWIAGIGSGKRLFFGQVTRWSKSSVWVNPTPTVPKSKEQCITIPLQTVVLPHGVDYEQSVTMMALQGWKGYGK